MIRRSDTSPGFTVWCDLCPKSINLDTETFKDTVKRIIGLGWEIRQEVKRTESGYGPPIWKNYCPDCRAVEGILID